MRFTAIIEQDEKGVFVGQIEEIPAAIAQGETLDELRTNLQDALSTIFELNRDEVEAEYEGKIYFKEEIVVP